MSVVWPKRVGEYRLHKGDDNGAFYYYQMGGFAFYQAMNVQLLRAKGDPALTLVEIELLSGNGWGTKCQPADPMTFNWTYVRSDYYASFVALLQRWGGDELVQSLSHTKLRAWERRAARAMAKLA